MRTYTRLAERANRSYLLCDCVIILVRNRYIKTLYFVYHHANKHFRDWNCEKTKLKISFTVLFYKIRTRYDILLFTDEKKSVEFVSQTACMCRSEAFDGKDRFRIIVRAVEKSHDPSDGKMCYVRTLFRTRIKTDKSIIANTRDGKTRYYINGVIDDYSLL